MPTYFFDVYDNETLQSDDFGVELDDLYEARIQAIDLLPHIAEDANPGADHHVFKVVVKCQEQRVRYVATLTLNGTWVEPPMSPKPAPDEHGIVVEASARSGEVVMPCLRSQHGRDRAQNAESSEVIGRVSTARRSAPTAAATRESLR